jgi:hypothetical protein
VGKLSVFVYGDTWMLAEIAEKTAFEGLSLDNRKGCYCVKDSPTEDSNKPEDLTSRPVTTAKSYLRPENSVNLSLRDRVVNSKKASQGVLWQCTIGLEGNSFRRLQT